MQLKELLSLNTPSILVGQVLTIEQSKHWTEKAGIYLPYSPMAIGYRLLVAISHAEGEEVKNPTAQFSRNEGFIFVELFGTGHIGYQHPDVKNQLCQVEVASPLVDASESLMVLQRQFIEFRGALAQKLLGGKNPLRLPGKPGEYLYTVRGTKIAGVADKVEDLLPAPTLPSFVDEDFPDPEVEAASNEAAELEQELAELEIAV